MAAINVAKNSQNQGCKPHPDSSLFRGVTSIHPRALLAGLALLLAGGQSHSQTTFWNNLDDAWGNATSWTAGVPTASTLASFDPKSSILTQLNQTVQLTGAGNNALGLALSNSYSLGQGYDFFGGLGSKIIVSGSGI
ncbi:MAG: hypothetical protein N2322_07045, partial [Terrimicrobiaceae bacterium]|nr:hypothetical protein [Terrimicrobiaceae bacterium]